VKIGLLAVGEKFVFVGQCLIRIFCGVRQSLKAMRSWCKRSRVNQSSLVHSFAQCEKVGQYNRFEMAKFYRQKSFS
jgi:hypothetical protein